MLIGQPPLLQCLSLSINEEIRSRVTYSALLSRLAPETGEQFILDQLDRAVLGHNTFTPEALSLIVRFRNGISNSSNTAAAISFCPPFPGSSSKIAIGDGPRATKPATSLTSSPSPGTFVPSSHASDHCPQEHQFITQHSNQTGRWRYARMTPDQTAGLMTLVWEKPAFRKAIQKRPVESERYDQSVAIWAQNTMAARNKPSNRYDHSSANYVELHIIGLMLSGQ